MREQSRHSCLHCRAKFAHKFPPVNLTILVFAQARDAFGFAERAVACVPDETPRELMQRVAPGVSLEHVRAALDCEYVTWDTPIGEAAELAIIPPVSGG